MRIVSDFHILVTEVKKRATELGFDLCGIAPVAPSSFKPEFLAWLERAYQGEMAWMARDHEKRMDPRLVMEDAHSIVAVAMNYYTEDDPSPDPNRAVFARYARGDDYHDVMTAKLRQLLDFIREREPAVAGRIYVDTGPLLEREIAQRAGLGWFGKNTMLINSRRGSWFLLGEILLSLPLPPDEPAAGGCGTCTRCLDACPTGALVSPYVLDANRCISYLTIELKGEIPQELAPFIGNRIFGCDICQEVCPHNVKFAKTTTEPAFQPRTITTQSKVADLLSMTDEEFRKQFKNSAVKRTKRRGLVRNATAASKHE